MKINDLKDGSGKLAIFLEELRQKNNIEYSKIQEYLEQNSKDIEDIEHIFELRSREDAQVLITLPKLLFEEKEAEEIIACIKEDEKDSKYFDSKLKPDVEGLKVLLITAFIENPAFFVMVWNWCAMFRQEIYNKKKGENERK